MKKPVRFGEVMARWNQKRTGQKPPLPQKPAPLALPAEARVSLLVPYRETPERAQLWAFIRAKYEARFPAWEIVTDEGPEGEFCRTGAICDAAQKATGDIFVVVDADVWCEGIEDAAARVHAGAAWVDPAGTVVVRMTKAATEAALNGGPLSEKGAPPPLRRVSCAGAVVLSRKAFRKTPPDRRFVGWGGEATAWNAELVRAYGPATKGLGATLWHFWHPPVERKTSRENQRLMVAHVEGRAAPVTPLPERVGDDSTPTPLTRPRVAILADVRTWAWHKKATALREALADRFDCSILYSSEHDSGPAIAKRDYDILHTFEVSQAAGLPHVPFVTGITAHVWPTWEKRHGKGTVRKWCERALGVHANSRMLQAELGEYLSRPVYYVPNGVDEQFFRRMKPRESRNLIVGFVGKDNPRKGWEIVAAACKKAGVELREVRRRSGNALTAEEMRDFYQEIHVLAVASDMDGTPNPALEAAACECAVVSNHIGNMPEFIRHGVNGLFHDRSVDQLAGALWALSQKPIEEVEEMGRAARFTVEAEWTWRAMAENYGAMWTECIRARP